MRNNRLSQILIFAIIALALFVRFQGINSIEFKEDEAKNCFLSADLVQRGIIPLVGDKSSISTFNPPLFTYLISIPFTLSTNPVVMSGFIACLNILAVYFCFLFCKQFFSERAGLIASLYFAVNPWVVLYSRKIWANNAIPLFIMLFFFSLYKVIFDNRPKYLITLFIAFGVFTQLHMVTFPFAAILFIALLARRKSCRPGYLSVGIVSFLVLYTPYILFELRHQCIDIQTILRMSKEPGVFHTTAFAFPFRLASTVGFLKNTPIIDLLQIVLLIVSGIYAALRIRDLRYCFLLLWLCILPVCLAFSKTLIENHYFIACFPVQFILIGICVDALCNTLSKKSVTWIYPVLGFVLLIITCQFTATLSFNHFIRQEKNIAWNGYGPPYRAHAEEIARTITGGCFTSEKIQATITEGKEAAEKYKYDFLATAYIAEQVNFRSGNPLVYNHRGNVYFEKEQFDRALASYSKALSLEPRFTEAYSNRGSLYALRSNFPRAIADFNEALLLDPANTGICMARGIVERKSGAYDKAIEDFSRVISLKPFFLPAYYQRAVAYYDAQDYDKAWADINILREGGYPIEQSFLNDVQKASGRTE